MADGPSRVPLHSLEVMTDNFSKDRLLGSGSYGKVYLGERKDGQKIAVKILHDMPGHDDVQFDKEFYNLVNLQHQNIVRLVGFCHETRRELWLHNETRVLADVTKRALCFEFMENGSLNSYLFDEFNGHGWRNRYAIIKGMCNGLKYLHEELKPPIFHLDLKPANILLDNNMIPKIADFGLSRFFKEEKSHITNSPIGTPGYLPPEFVNQNIISNKLDIFSLGVVIIKIMAGPTGYSRSDEMTSEQFAEIVHGNWRNRLQAAAAGGLLESYCVQVKRCIEIALSCVVADRRKRPTIGDIVNMLNETQTLENYQGALIDQMSTCIVKDTELIDVHPLQLHFSFRPNKFISCPFHVTNNMDDQHVSVRCVPKHEEATRYYYARLGRIVGVVPPRSTHTFVVTMKEVQQPPANMDVLDIVVETILGEVSLDYQFETYFKNARKENSRGFREVTLKAVCATTSETTTSEMSTCIVKDTELIDVHPLQLHFSFRQNKFFSCPFHVTNNMDDQHVSVRCVPKGRTCYYTDLHLMCGTVPPRSTHTFVVTMKEVQRPPGNIVVEIILMKASLDFFERRFEIAREENRHGFHEMALKAVCATTCEKTTSEVILRYGYGDYHTLRSMDVHPTEPWILAAYPIRLVIWNYKTQTRMMEGKFFLSERHSSDVEAIKTVRFIAQSTEQLFLVGDRDGHIHVHECMAMKGVKEFKAHDCAVTSFAVHPTQPFVLSASKDQLIKLWNWEKDWECIRTFTGHSRYVNQVKFNPHDVNTFASASDDGTVKIWRIFSPTHFTSLNCKERQHSVDYYPTGGDQQHYMVTGSERGTARIWDLQTQTCIREIKGLKSFCEVGVIDCLPDRPVLATASGITGVSLHDLTTYRCERTGHFGLGDVVCFAYSKGTRSLAIAHQCGVAIVEIDEFSKKVLPPAR